MPNVIKTFDTSNPQTFHSFSTVYGGRSSFMEQGYLGQYPWKQKTSDCTKREQPSIAATSLPRNDLQADKLPHIPELSNSVDSENDDLATVYEPSGSTTNKSPYKSLEEKQAQNPVFPDTTSLTTVVHGFSTSRGSISRATSAPPKTSLDAIPEPRSSPAAKTVQSKKQPLFSIGESCYSGEQGQVESSEDSKDKNSAIADDSETDYVDESAIDDDDDSSDWEDSFEDSNRSSIDEKTFFQRVDSKVNLTSRRSLLTLMIEQKNHTGKNLGNIASQSTLTLPWSRTSHPTPPTAAVSPKDSDDAPLMMKRGIRSSPLKPINKVPRSAARLIRTPASHNRCQNVMSPRTTHREMQAKELPNSLRRNLLWERQQKSSTANAVLKRRHTSHDVANLIPNSEYPPEFAYEGYRYKVW
ncbi:hypothetical protein QIS74_13659 [Colletotrichum tabaci]|uniref:DUF3295 domain-containing protein n=1 Tax=Colletotrichum tabaci TaxID=1209068 RepID=A0AAV9SUF3_9PEZI